MHPNKIERERLGKLISKNYKLNGEKVDICISGLGYCTLVVNGNIKVTSFENIKIIKREAII